MHGLLVAIGFLTRIPVPARVFDIPGAQARSLPWYPLVGVLIGALLCALGWLLRDAPPLLGAALLLATWVGLTGALHLDGLADSADAWIGGLGGTDNERRARTLEIMKDPRSGPAAIVVLELLLLLKFAALASLPMPAWPALLLAPMLARAGLTALFLTTPYVRADGIGAALRAAPRAACIVAVVLALAVALANGWRGALAVAAALAVWLAWRHASQRRIGGFTGDTAGAACEMIETSVLVVLALA